MSSHHIIIPGQIIATSSALDEENSFLRGHGTYLENVVDPNNNNNIDGNPSSNIIQTTTNNVNNNNDNNNDDDEDVDMQQQAINNQQHHLISSTTGTITRTNKLIQITPPNGQYTPQTGDPIIGRISSISAQKWNVSLNLTSNSISMNASLPLTGIHMPDGMQRIRTNADALVMRTVLSEGDLISTEVRSVQSGSSGGGGGGGSGASAIGNVILHARSVRCGKLENGCFVMVPSWLIARRKKQFVVLGLGGGGGKGSSSKGFDGILVEVLLGCNGGIWIQLAMMELESSSSGSEVMVQEKVQRIRSAHAKKNMTIEERTVVARVRNAIEALKLVFCRITPENIESVVAASSELGYDVVDMLRHDVIAKITACTRNNK